MQSVCVFCGSSLGRDPAYAEAARDLGRALAASRRTLVYGGGNVGLMGAVAGAVMEAGGKVVGVMPKMLIDTEDASAGITELRVVQSMHERKAVMESLSDGFIALPGGFGTLEEFCEILTWAQLGLHQKPIGLLNVRGFYDLFLHFLDHAVAEQLIKPRHRARVLVGKEGSGLLEQMESVVREPEGRQMDPEQM